MVTELDIWRVAHLMLHEYGGKAEHAERERTLSEKILRLSRDLNDGQLSARQRTLLRAELQAALSNLEARLAASPIAV